MAMRIVEVEKAKCRHLHAWNYDPAKVVIGKPVEPLPNGQHLCMDCGELFEQEVPVRRYTWAQIEQLAIQWRNENKITNDAQWIVSHCSHGWRSGSRGRRVDDVRRE